MFLRLVLLLTVVPFVELVILLRLAEWMGWRGTLGLVILTGVLGAWLARREGLKVFIRIQNDLASGITPAGAVVDGLLILVAGIVLITPGILTDLCGFALLIPPVRRLVARQLIRAFSDRMIIMHHRPGEHPDDPGEPEFIDVPGASREVDGDSNDEA